MNKKNITCFGLAAVIGFAIGLSFARPVQAAQQTTTLRYEAVYAGSGNGAFEDARTMTTALNQRAATGWRFVSATGNVLVFSKE